MIIQLLSALWGVSAPSRLVQYAVLVGWDNAHNSRCTSTCRLARHLTIMQTMKSAPTSHMRRTIQPFTSHSGTAVVRATAAASKRQLCTTVAASATLASSASSSFNRSFAASVHVASRSSGSSRRARHLIVKANWGAPVEFTAAKIVSNVKAAEMLHRIVIDVGDLASGYTKGGQFMQIKVSSCQQDLLCC